MITRKLLNFVFDTPKSASAPQINSIMFFLLGPESIRFVSLGVGRMEGTLQCAEYQTETFDEISSFEVALSWPLKAVEASYVCPEYFRVN